MRLLWDVFDNPGNGIIGIAIDQNCLPDDIGAAEIFFCDGFGNYKTVRFFKRRFFVTGNHIQCKDIKKR